MKAEEERIKKLPSWAREHIDRLVRLGQQYETEIENWRQKAYQAARGPGAQVSIVDDINPRASLGLPDDSRVRFKMPGDRFIDVIRNKNGGLDVCGSLADLEVKPRAANHILICFEKDI